MKSVQCETKQKSAEKNRVAPLHLTVLQSAPSLHPFFLVLLPLVLLLQLQLLLSLSVLFLVLSDGSIETRAACEAGDYATRLATKTTVMVMATATATVACGMRYVAEATKTATHIRPTTKQHQQPKNWAAYGGGGGTQLD